MFTLTAFPILYSFRRCPYAIRARMTLYYSQKRVELREISLKNKPKDLLLASPKAQVPVLILNSGDILDESLDIMLWSLQVSDPDHWLPLSKKNTIMQWIQKNDLEFKPQLDRYKYAERYPEYPRSVYRAKIEAFYHSLEASLSQHDFLAGAHISLADIALFPFIRQSAFVDKTWFEQAPFPHLQAWLQWWLKSSLFLNVMAKYPVWEPGSTAIYL
jgi:glutathione S-transferase